MTGVLIGTGLFFIFFLILFIVIGKIHYQEKYQNKYTFKGFFPFEFNYKSSIKENFLMNLSFLISFIGGLAFYICFLIATHTDGLFIGLAISGIISMIALVFIVMLPFNFLRCHMASSTIFMAFMMALTSMNTVIAFKNSEDFSNILAVISFIINLVLLLIVVLLIINPKFSLTFSAKESVDENNNKVYQRPKLIVYALTEWIFIFLLIIGTIMSFVNYFLF